MKKIKIVAIIGLLIGINSISAQNKTDVALEVVEILHANDLGGKFKIRAPRSVDSLTVKKTTKKDADYKKELYAKLAEEYRTQFNKEELNDLLAFYNSDLGKKVVKNETKNSQMFSKQLSAIRRKQREEQLGIPSREERRKKRLEESSLPLKAEKSLKKDAGSIKEINEEVYPEIETLEDFRKILLKNPRLIRDPKLLNKILGKDVDVQKLMRERRKQR